MRALPLRRSGGSAQAIFEKRHLSLYSTDANEVDIDAMKKALPDLTVKAEQARKELLDVHKTEEHAHIHRTVSGLGNAPAKIAAVRLDPPPRAHSSWCVRPPGEHRPG